MASRLVLAAFVAVVGLLVWDHVQAADPPATHIESRQITVRTTHDTLHVEWNTGYPAEEYSVNICKAYEYWNYSGFAFGPSWGYVVGPQAPFELTVSGLDPGTIYVVEVFAGDWRDSRPGVVVVRTESVPDKWWDNNIAKSVHASAFGDHVFVSWQCVDDPLVSELEVEISEYGATRLLTKTVVVACEVGGVLVEAEELGTAYSVAVRPAQMESYEKTSVVAVPSMIRERKVLPVAADSVPALPQWDVTVSYSREARAWVFKVSVERNETIPYFEAPIEVEWIYNGYRMSRIMQESTFVYHSDSRGPYPFRIRWVNVHGAFSPWSNVRMAGVLPSPPYGIRYEKSASEVHVAWRGNRGPGDGGGYQVIIHERGARMRVVDTGTAPRTVFNIDPSQDEIVFYVRRYDQVVGPGELKRFVIDLTEQPELELQVDDWQPYCNLAEEIPARGIWRVRHGAAPYLVKIGDNEPVLTSLPIGAFESGCDIDEGERDDVGKLITDVSVEVEDRLGRRMRGVLEYAILGHDQEDARSVELVNEPGPTRLDLVETFVGSDLVRWFLRHKNTDHHYWLTNYWIKWRVSGEMNWKYELDRIRASLTTYVGLRWEGLEPDTAYQYQVAVEIPGVSAEEIPDGAWTQLREVHTLPSEISPTVVQAGSSVKVQWRRVSGALDYSVVLRGDGESWWKTYLPNGTENEAVVFDDVPAEGVLRAELVSPSLAGSFD